MSNLYRSSFTLQRCIRVAACSLILSAVAASSTAQITAEGNAAGILPQKASLLVSDISDSAGIAAVANEPDAAIDDGANASDQITDNYNDNNNQRPDLVAPMRAEVSLYDLSGQPIAEANDEESFRIRVVIKNLAGSSAPEGLYLRGWLRPISIRNLTCVEAAKNYRATQRLATGTVDLSGGAIGVLDTTGNLTIVDPEFTIATANMLGAAHFDGKPTELFADLESRRFLLSDVDQGDVWSVGVYGDNTEKLLSGLSQPSLIVPADDNSLWVYESGSAEIKRWIDGEAQSVLPASGAKVSLDGDFMVLWQGAKLSIVDVNSADILHEFDAVSAHDIRDVELLMDEQGVLGVAVLSGAGLGIYYLDSVSEPTMIQMDSIDESIFTQLSVDPRSRIILAHSPVADELSVIDLAKNKAVQVVKMNPPIVDIKFSGDNAFMMTADQSLIGALDLRTIRRGELALVRQVQLGASRKSEDWLSAPGLMTQLLPEDTLLAVHAMSGQGYPIHDSSTMGEAPPMSAVKLRGGIPHQIAVIDRGFAEPMPGVFETVAKLPTAGAYELVLTTGIGGLSICSPISSGSFEAAGVGMAAIQHLDNEDYLSIHSADGDPVAISGEATIMSLNSGWRQVTRFSTSANGLSKLPVSLPDSRPIVMTIRTKTGLEFHPLIIE